ncbi:hypothetical protein TeGR_g8641 [Tetraparma gracilis]|uniref:Uncharacterized protein n=1 Tax=Tetraparma gracilis TaxID=2962635 RepID=A0ABQ6MLL8_9STRA|nr:hypothetical protein TeGR_g8641 [Tetraparma gracilis]
MGGSIPRFISRSVTTPAAVVAPLDALRYYNQVKPAGSFEAADAKELGQLLVLDTDKVAWGVKFRAYLGAGVSAADGLSDAYMIKTFYDMGDTANAKGLLAMVGANLAGQGIIVYGQCQGLKKNRWKTALLEMLTVVSFVKPGLDAYRVASGAEQLPGAALSPLNEMIYTKGGELFFEAIPGLVLQLVALLNAEQVSNVAIGSILISTASTALTATTMFWDWDTDPGNRKSSPDW